jgi:hypothetical protein
MSEQNNQKNFSTSNVSVTNEKQKIAFCKEKIDTVDDFQLLSEMEKVADEECLRLNEYETQELFAQLDKWLNSLLSNKKEA